jgi:hypothetical protein
VEVVIQSAALTVKPTEDSAMQAPRAGITTRRLMIGAAVASSILGAVAFVRWLWLPLVEPTKALNHDVSAKQHSPQADY